MAVPNVKTKSINDALEYIDQHGIPHNNQSTGYDLINDEEKRYPPKYVIAVAKYLEGQTPDITTLGCGSRTARAFLKKLGFTIAPKNKTNKNMNSKDKVALTKMYSGWLLKSKNIVFRGAPGTGKTYLSNQIAASIITNNKESDFKKLTEEQQQQVEFVQFHPSYDYTDFVDKLMPLLF